MTISVGTGGNDPAYQTQLGTGGPLPPSSTPSNVHTGGNDPAYAAPVTPPAAPPPPGDPPQTVPGYGSYSGGPNSNQGTGSIPLLNWQAGLAGVNTNAVNRTVQPNELASTQLNNLTAQGSQYLTQAADRARNEASNRGMMMSTMAAGAGSRAAIDAAMPIAQQDANTYATTASQNMAATNADRLADQQMGGQLLGQSMGIRANLDEAQQGRLFTGYEDQLQRQYGTSERVATENFTARQQQLQNAWQGAQNNTQIAAQLQVQEQQLAHDTAMRELDRSFQGSQTDKQLAMQRFQDFTNAMGSQTNMLAQTITSIYNNPNLNASQQAAAVQNARAIYQSLFTSYAQSLSGGVPPIFWQPYQMNTSAAPPAPGTTPATGLTVPPGAPPPPGGGGSILNQVGSRFVQTNHS